MFRTHPVTRRLPHALYLTLNGPVKSRYRRYNLEGFEPGDDYAAMREVLSRRYQKLQKEEGHLPDLILVDGGKGQLGIAMEVLSDCGLSDIPLMGVAKGPSTQGRL